MITASIFEAKTNLSNLVKHAQKFVLSERFFEPLPEADLELWNGGGK